MVDERREDELKRTARARGSSRDGNEEVAAMRDLESMSNTPPERVDCADLPEVKRAIDPAAAIPPKAPDSVKQEMGAKMERFKREVDRHVPGETVGQRDARLHKLRTELWPDASCDCNGTGLIIRRGSLRRRDGRGIPNSTWVETCDCPHGQARRGSEADLDQGADAGAGDGLEDVF